MRRGAEPFDEAYFDRYYESARTRVQGPREVARLIRGVLELIRWLDEPIDTVLDVGAGPGLWRDWFARYRPSVAYRSTDVSPYACRRYGHEQKDITSFRARKRYDLVVCQGVLPYLDNEGAERAIDNLGAMTRKFMYLECATAADLDSVCDTSRTDLSMQRRSGRWYAERLARHFDMVGMGLWVSKRLALPLYQLESGTRCFGVS